MIHHFWDTFFGTQVVGTIAGVSEVNPQPHTIYSNPSLQSNIYYTTIVVSEDSVSNQ